MSRRSTLPGAAELFRTTGAPAARSEGAADPSAEPGSELAPERSGRSLTSVARPDVFGLPQAEEPGAGSAAGGPRGVRRRSAAPSGRERHDEKITVYVSPAELLDLEHARLALRGEHGLAVDRGRIVREALAVVIADLEAKGEESILVRRLRGL
jgi:hypothetical protein